ncbi:MAG: TonB C-terminal domain-containing protein [Deltaproteobacteria bacterium]|nr:TonB C-terminal domain-containing protein [Deltaproteobacteria bacterium]
MTVRGPGALQSAAIDKSSGCAEHAEAILRAIDSEEPFAKPDTESGPYVGRGSVLSFEP